MLTIGYLIPEFPGQTHIFFWREMQALLEREIHPEIVSTRKPPAGIISHAWARQAMERTCYLAPISPRDALVGLIELLRRGPAAWRRCLSAARRADSSSMGARLRLLAMIPLAARLAGLARRNGWRHLHVHSCADAANIAMFAHLLSGLSYSITLHGPLRDYGANQRQKWRHASFAIVITRKLRDEVLQALDGDLPPTLCIAPMGVDLVQLQRRCDYSPWPGAGTLRLFCCARLNPAKGHDDLIRAVALVRQEGLDAQLTIAGEDDAGGAGYRKTVEGLIAELGLPAHVTLLGAVPEQRVRDELQRAHLFVLASRAEPLGVAIMEAMAMQVPVVVTRAGGVPELVSDGADGLLVDPRNPRQLADAIVRLARDGELCRQFSLEGRRKVSKSFHSGVSAEVMAQQVRRLP